MLYPDLLHGFQLNNNQPINDKIGKIAPHLYTLVVDFDRLLSLTRKATTLQLKA